jgi:hypothetical protein
LVDLLIRDAQEEEDDSELLMADDEDAGAAAAKKTIVHVAELFSMLNDDSESGDTAVVNIPKTLHIDDHCAFPKTANAGGTELATTPVANV